MDAELAQKMAEMNAKIDEMRAALHKMQRYFQITFWVTVVCFVVPLVGLMFALPKAMNAYLGSMNIDDVQQGLQDY